MNTLLKFILDFKTDADDYARIYISGQNNTHITNKKSSQAKNLINLYMAIECDLKAIYCATKYHEQQKEVDKYLHEFKDLSHNLSKIVNEIGKANNDELKKIFDKHQFCNEKIIPVPFVHLRYSCELGYYAFSDSLRFSETIRSPETWQKMLSFHNALLSWLEIWRSSNTTITDYIYDNNLEELTKAYKHSVSRYKSDDVLGRKKPYKHKPQNKK